MAVHLELRQGECAELCFQCGAVRRGVLLSITTAEECLDHVISHVRVSRVADSHFTSRTTVE